MGEREPKASATVQEHNAGAARTSRAALVRWGAVAFGGVLIGLLIGLLVRSGWPRHPSEPLTPDPNATIGATATRFAVTPSLPPAGPAATPTPTPSPAQLRDEAELAAQEGDFGAAAELYVDLLDAPDGGGLDPGLALGAVLLRDGQHRLAAATLQSVAEAAGGGETARLARFLLAEAYAGSRDWGRAAVEYRRYIASGTVITGYVQEWIGDALRADGDTEGAIAAYRAAAAEAPNRSVEVGVREKAALALTAQERYGEAIEEYETILAMARDPGYRAHIEYQAAETELLAGRTDAAVARHRRVVAAYPAEDSAHASLVRLVERGEAVDDRLRGIVDYHAGVYDLAVLVLSRYYLANPVSHLGDVHWYAGKAYLALGDPGNAAREFSLLIDTHPGHSLVDDAWMGLAEAYAAAGDAEAAVFTYQKLAELRPLSPQAPDALWEAALLLEREGELELAREAYLDCQVRYPESDRADGALLRGGLQAYRLGDELAAAVTWDTLASTTAVSYYRAASLFWLGKVRAHQGDLEGASESFLSAAEADPAAYYGLRASQLATQPSAPPFSSRPVADEIAEDAGQDDAEAWLAEWVGVETAEYEGTSGAEMTVDVVLQRGLELWRVGRFAEGRAELEQLRVASKDDPLALYELALLFREIGLYRSSILCAVRLVAISPAVSVLEAPPFIGRLAYPDHYRRLVVRNAEEFGLDPLLVLSLVRQESLFESLATSTASAQGLMQVIPSTGELIAVSLGWPPDYVSADLYRPYVSVRFGTYYLATQRDQFEGRIEVALAAYNGGPGNAMRWVREAGADPDLLVELITYRETRQYLQRIQENLAVYQALYGQ